MPEEQRLYDAFLKSLGWSLVPGSMPARLPDDGVVRFKFDGYLNFHRLAEELEASLRLPEAATSRTALRHAIA